jgi:hypothetical protein
LGTEIGPPNKILDNRFSDCRRALLNRARRFQRHIVNDAVDISDRTRRGRDNHDQEETAVAGGGSDFGGGGVIYADASRRGN